jgi:hypothetical protein
MFRLPHAVVLRILRKTPTRWLTKTGDILRVEFGDWREAGQGDRSAQGKAREVEAAPWSVVIGALLAAAHAAQGCASVRVSLPSRSATPPGESPGSIGGPPRRGIRQSSVSGSLDEPCGIPGKPASRLRPG